MNILIKKITSFALIFSFSLSVYADSAGDAAGAVLVTFVGAKGIQSITANALESMELDEWKDDRSRATSQFGESCGFITEARLIGDVRKNYLWLSMKNVSGKMKVFKTIDTEYIFSSGVRRKPDIFRFQEIYFEPGRVYNVILPFPLKEEFAEQRDLEIRFPVIEGENKCESRIVMQRNPKVPDTVRGTVSMDAFDAELALGAAYLSGEFGSLFSVRNMDVMDLNLHFYGPYGGGFYLGTRYYNSQISRDFALAEGLGTSIQLRSSDIKVGYVHRYFIDRNSQIHWKLYVGSGTLSLASEADVVRKYGFYLGGGQAFYQRYFSRVKSGIWRGNYYYGVSISADHISVNKDLNDKSRPYGISNSIMFSIGVGG